MKKLLAMMLVLAMALGCVGALAEETAPSGATVRAGIHVNADLVTMLALQGADDETTGAIIQTIVSLVNNLGLKAAIADNGCQLDVTLKDGTLLTVAAQGDENGLVAATDLLPEYVFTVSGETIQQLLAQLQETLGSGMNLDVDALMETIAPHVEKLMAYVQEHTGEPEPASATFEGVEFTSKIPFNFETKELLTIVADMVKEVASSDAFAGIASQIPDFDASQIDAFAQEIAQADPADMPVTDAAMYTNEAGDTYTVVNVTKDDETVAVTVGTFSDRVSVTVDAGEQGQIALNVAPTDNGVTLTLKLDAQGMAVAVVVSFGMNEAGMGINADVYFMNLEAPLLSVTVLIENGAEITYAIDAEGKTVVSLEEIMAQGEDGEAVQQVMASLQNNLFSLIGKAQQLMPDEINTIISLMMPSDPAVETVAE